MGIKHTPAPWRVERQNGSPTTGEWMIAGAKPGYLAEVRNCGSGCVKANALLIAAAPELLEALEGIIELDENKVYMDEPWKVALAAARAAIAKAKGEEQ